MRGRAIQREYDERKSDTESEYDERKSDTESEYDERKSDTENIAKTPACYSAREVLSAGALQDYRALGLLSSKESIRIREYPVFAGSVEAGGGGSGGMGFLVGCSLAQIWSDLAVAPCAVWRGQRRSRIYPSWMRHMASNSIFDTFTYPSTLLRVSFPSLKAEEQ
ncbi:hypothetical protein NFI96_023488 [Prochilodus magdalenae]|nr:hypothetical protein NFI96_023488 [Prochilodus magdalenae]